MPPIKISYHSDVLCIWAYVAQARLEQVIKHFGDQVAIDTHYCSVFPDAWGKIEEMWKTRGGFAGFNKHLMEVAERFPHTAVHKGLWLDVRPRTSASAHLFLKAVELIEQEAALDGIYVIRTSESEAHLSAAEVVRGYKRLTRVERAFRCMKGIDLRVRPIYLRLEDHIRGHLLVCMLAYYVEWHMREALAPLLFHDEALASDRESRDPVAPAQPSTSVRRKKVLRVDAAGLPLHSFTSLLHELATVCRNTCRLASQPNAPTFDQLTQPTPLQQRAFELIDTVPMYAKG